MFVVGLTGGIGSGKTTVADAFAALGIDIVDADLLSREAVLPGSETIGAIASHFGENILDANGALKRSELRKIVFANDQHRQWLENLLHPIIADLMQQKLATASSPYCVLVSPLLLETAQVDLVQRVLVIDVSEQTQLQRTLARDGSDTETVKGILAAQLAREQRLQAADDVLDNEQPLVTLPARVQELHEKYLTLAKDYDKQEH